MRLIISLVVALFCLPATAAADSWCGFQNGLIGTKARGYIQPGRLEPYDLDAGLNPNTVDCAVSVYAAPIEDSAPIGTRLCHTFHHVPSPYVDTIESAEQRPVSDYFSFQVFDSDGKFIQIQTHAGERVWVKKLRNSTLQPAAYRYREGSTPSQSASYATPYLSSAYNTPMGGYFRSKDRIYHLAPDEIDAFLQLKALQPLVTAGIIDPQAPEKFLELPINKGGLELSYRYVELIKDDEGREWIKAEAYLEITGGYPYFLSEMDHGLSEAELQKLEDAFRDFKIVESAPLRTVYFPHREPSGTITMVLTNGDYCD